MSAFLCVANDVFYPESTRRPLRFDLTHLIDVYPRETVISAVSLIVVFASLS